MEISVRINELLTLIHQENIKIESLQSSQSKCTSDISWWGLQSEIDDCNLIIQQHSDELEPLIKNLCSDLFGIDIYEANRIKDKADETILGLEKYKPAAYKKTIAILCDVVGSDSPF